MIPQFDVLLTYNYQDKAEVKIITQKLKRRGIKLWLDEEQIPPGCLFQDEIQQAIQNVKSAVIFIGSGGLGKWQKLELQSLISQLVNAGIPVIPVLLPGVQEIPRDLLFLQQLSRVDFSNGIDDPQTLERLVWGITQAKLSNL